MSAIQQLVDDIHGDATLVALVGGNYAIGRLPLKENNSPPRVVWIPVDGEIQATDNIGGRVNGTDKRRQVRTRLQNFEVNVWGTDVANTEDIMDAIVAVGWRHDVGSISFGSFSWFTQQPATADYAELGQKVVMEVSIKIPIHDYTLPLTDIDAEGHIVTFVSDTTGIPEVIC
ncbi:MAG: hypothetical protein ACTSX8_00545 [Alphaproteobacteria bacterium]